MAKKRRMIETGPIVGIILIAIALISVGIFAAIYFGLLRFGPARASVSVVATGEASPDGASATIRLAFQNTGDGAARIYHIVIETPPGTPTLNISVIPSTSPGPVNTTIGTFTTLNLTLTSPPTTNYTEIPARGQGFVTIRLSGSAGAVLPGTTLRIYIAVFDMGARSTSYIETTVTLR